MIKANLIKKMQRLQKQLLELQELAAKREESLQEYIKLHQADFEKVTELEAMLKKGAELAVGLGDENLRLLKSNETLRTHLSGDQYKIEMFYRRCMDLMQFSNEWHQSANYWRVQADEFLKAIIRRGEVRSKYDMPYAIWRDAVMERLACDPTRNYYDAGVLATKLGEMVNGQLPDGSNDFLEAMRRVAEESDYELRDNKFWPVEKKLNPAGTLITMGDGTRKPIEEIKVGDEVLTHKGTIGEMFKDVDKRVLQALDRKS
jgi:hypothetical protein